MLSREMTPLAVTTMSEPLTNQTKHELSGRVRSHEWIEIRASGQGDVHSRVNVSGSRLAEDLPPECERKEPQNRSGGNPVEGFLGEVSVGMEPSPPSPGLLDVERRCTISNSRWVKFSFFLSQCGVQFYLLCCVQPRVLETVNECAGW